MKNITVGTASSKASLDTNFRNVQDNFVELFGRVTAASQIAIQEAVSSGAKTIHVEAGWTNYNSGRCIPMRRRAK